MTQTHIADVLVYTLPKNGVGNHNGVQSCIPHAIVSITDLASNDLEGMGRGWLTDIHAIILNQTTKFFKKL